MNDTDPVLIKRLSEEVFEKLYPLALELVRAIETEHGPGVAANVLTNALVSTTAWQMGNHMGFLGVWDNDQERQAYCTAKAEALYRVFLDQPPTGPGAGMRPLAWQGMVCKCGEPVPEPNPTNFGVCQKCLAIISYTPSPKAIAALAEKCIRTLPDQVKPHE